MKMLNVYVDFVEDIEDLSDAEVGRLFRSMLMYAADDSYDADLKGNERFLWKAARKTIKRQWADYREMCERNQKIATTRNDSSRLVTKKHDSSEDKDKDKDKEKTKTVIETPIIPFSGELCDAVGDWLSYKKEKRQPYKPTGLKSLMTQIRNAAEEYGDEAVVNVIRDSMSSNYQGIMFDRLRKSKTGRMDALMRSIKEEMKHDQARDEGVPLADGAVVVELASAGNGR